MLTLIKRDNTVFSVLLNQDQKERHDRLGVRPIKRFFSLLSVFHKPLQEPVWSDTLQFPFYIIGGQIAERICVCIYECESGGSAVYAADAAPFHFSSFPAPSAYLSRWRMRSREKPLISASLFYVRAVRKKSRRITQTDFQFSLCNKQMH